MLPAEQSRPDIAFKRARWQVHQDRIDPRRLVFIDETWIKTNMAPLRGWGPRGQRLGASVPHGHWKTTTFTGALRLTGMTAPFVYDGAMNGNVFLAYVNQVLVPTLAPDEVVIMDNLPAGIIHVKRYEYHSVLGVHDFLLRRASSSISMFSGSQPLEKRICMPCSCFLTKILRSMSSP